MPKFNTFYYKKKKYTCLWRPGDFKFSGFGCLFAHSRENSPYNTIFLQIILFAYAIQVTQALLELFQIQFSFDIGNLYMLGIYFQISILKNIFTSSNHKFTGSA